MRERERESSEEGLDSSSIARREAAALGSWHGEDTITDTLTRQQRPREGQDAPTGSLLARQRLWASLESKGAFLFCEPQDPPSQTNQGHRQGPLAFSFLEILSSNGQTALCLRWIGQGDRSQDNGDPESEIVPGAPRTPCSQGLLISILENKSSSRTPLN